MVTCPRCNREVSTLQSLTPDLVTREREEAFGQSEEDNIEVCSECFEKLTAG